jgi:hypothetical protein
MLRVGLDKIFIGVGMKEGLDEVFAGARGQEEEEMRFLPELEMKREEQMKFLLKLGLEKEE